jgi:hypothetical protein
MHVSCTRRADTNPMYLEDIWLPECFHRKHRARQHMYTREPANAKLIIGAHFDAERTVTGALR